ncbi:MAG: M12 family metallo-peptidase [Pyrinomonadaceae bacterium]
MSINNGALIRTLFVAVGVFAAAGLMAGPALLHTAAQKPTKSDLFVQVDQSTRDLTPEQEALLAKIKQETTTAETRLVTVRTALLSPSPTSLLVNVKPGKQFEVLTTETRPGEEGIMTWIGKPQAPSDAAVFIVDNGNVTGTIREGNELYSVRPLGGGLHVVIRQDQTKFPPEHPPQFAQLEKEAPKEFPSLAIADVSPGPKVLRVLVAYTPSVAAARPDINAFIDLAIAETNLSYTNSQVNIRAELAHAYQVSYQESSNQDSDLVLFRNNNDSVMDEVHNLRNTYSADVCVLLVNTGAFCGTASAILATESTAFAVVYYSCATGNYSFGHEIGHLQGARHNIEADPDVTPFAYGHGHYNQSGNWRTVMSYACPGEAGCPRIPYWSNPNLKYNGAPLGTEPYCNDARVLNETAPIVTAFRN